MATKRKSPSDVTPAPRSPKRNKEGSLTPTVPSSEPVNAFPITPQSTATTLSLSDKLLLRYLQSHGSEDPMYREAMQLLLNSRLGFQFKPNRVLVAVGQTFEADAGVADLLRSMPRDIKEEGIIFWIFSKLCKHIKSEGAVKEIVSILLEGVSEVSSRLKILDDLAPGLELETRFFESGLKADIIHAEGSEDNFESKQEKRHSNTSVFNEPATLNVEHVGGLLRSIPDRTDRCKALAGILRDAGLEPHDESQNSVLDTTSMLMETLLDTLGDTRTKTEVLSRAPLRAVVPLTKRSPDEGPRDDAESETVIDEAETIKVAYEESPRPIRAPVAPKTPFEQLEIIMNSLDSDEFRRHCVRRLAQPLGLDFFRNEYPAEVTTGRRAELDEEVGVPHSLRRQDNHDRVRPTPRKFVAACENRSCTCHRLDEFPKDHFSRERWPIVELMCHVLDGEPQAEQATFQRDTILAFLRRRAAGRKCHKFCASIQLARKIYKFDLSDHGLMYHQILAALQQSTDSHGGGGDNSRRAQLDRVITPFVYANFPLFPELSDCIDISAYGKPIMLDNILHIRADSIYPHGSLTAKGGTKTKAGWRQSATADYSPNLPRGPRADRYQPPRSEKPDRTRAFEANFSSDPRSPYPQSPSQPRSGTRDFYPSRRAVSRERQDPARCPSPRSRSIEGGGNHRHRSTQPRQDYDRVAAVTPLRPRY